MKVFLISIILIVLITYLYAWLRTQNVNSIIQNHFVPWKDKGIEIEYRAPEGLGQNEGCPARNVKQIGCIVFTLPTSIPVPQPLEDSSV